MGYLQSEEFTQRHALLPSHRVLAHATINAAKQLNDDKIGRIEPGAYGDCVILTANPLEDCRVLDSGPKGIWGVVKEGRVVVSRGEFKDKLEREGGLDVVLGVDEAH
jgi:imidazolonepropionase-like amidohydrolase